jgi:phosphoribosylaminoimidazolecarboxamide formyltransferase / IMP cyclohydrolase
MQHIQRALLSVSDKTGLLPFAKKLSALGAELLSTGGTAKAIQEAGITVTQVSTYTGSPEILGGRVKTLHPKIAGGILARSDQAGEAAEHNIPLIDLVVVNLYPFKEAVKKQLPPESIIEEIDIGGPTLLRAAAKNYQRTIVVCDPEDYTLVIEGLQQESFPEALRFSLARKVFAHTAAYDAAIAAYFAGASHEQFPEKFSLRGERVKVLRYGENPHQKAAFYADQRQEGPSLAREPLQGKELSFTNLLDADAALSAVREFEGPACVAVKHTTPCGVGIGESVVSAYQEAREADPVSIFGGVVAVNQVVDKALAQEMAKIFLEVIVAPSFTDEARQIFSAKKDLRLLEVGSFGVNQKSAAMDIRKISGGFLLQERNEQLTEPSLGKVVTKRSPTTTELLALSLAWRVVKHVKSNAIVLSGPTATLGIGAGQTSRVDAARLAVQKAAEFQKQLQGQVAASDAFFPFRDGVDALLSAGITAIVQPGGSKRDDEVIAAADEAGAAMLFVGERHFRH